jgi:hypothetical protein
LGEEPTETQVHEYDDAGRLVRTVVTREPEWTDLERDKMLALAEYESRICGCGLHESIADQDPDLELEFRVCPICAGLEQAGRQLHADDEKAIEALGKNPPPSAELPADGRHMNLRPKRPTDSDAGQSS